MKSNSLIISLLLASCAPLTQTSSVSDTHTKVLRNIDDAYEKQIKTVVVRPDFDARQSLLVPAVVELGQWNLLLEFDDLRSDRDNYYATIIHCNQDWTTSVLQDLD